MLASIWYLPAVSKHERISFSVNSAADQKHFLKFASNRKLGRKIL